MSWEPLIRLMIRHAAPDLLLRIFVYIVRELQHFANETDTDLDDHILAIIRRALHEATGIERDPSDEVERPEA